MTSGELYVTERSRPLLDALGKWGGCRKMSRLEAGGVVPLYDYYFVEKYAGDDELSAEAFLGGLDAELSDFGYFTTIYVGFSDLARMALPASTPPPCDNIAEYRRGLAKFLRGVSEAAFFSLHGRQSIPHYFLCEQAVSYIRDIMMVWNFSRDCPGYQELADCFIAGFFPLGWEGPPGPDSRIVAYCWVDETSDASAPGGPA